MKRTLEVSVVGLCVVVILSLAMACGGPAIETGGGSPERTEEASRLHDLFDREWENRLREDPLQATFVGRNDYDHRLPGVTPADYERRAVATRGFLEELEGIDRAALSTNDQVSYDIFRTQLEDRLADMEFQVYEVPINADSGFHSGFVQLPSSLRLTDTKSYEAYIARLREFPRWVGEHIANMRAGLERGMVQPKIVLEGYEATISAHVVEAPEESLFWRPFESFPPGVPEADRERLGSEGRQAIEESVVPGFAEFLEFMTTEYIPAGRDTLGASELPRGPEFYAEQIRQFTTLELTADEIHEIGLAEVARIRSEMETIIEEVEFEGTFAEFLHFLRTDPRFYPETPEELLKEAAWIAKRMDGQLPALFETLPRLPYTVAPVPDHIAPKSTAGRYVPSAPGQYWVNTYNLPSRTLYTLEALTLHEAVPGHHFQFAINQEQGELPEFRRYSYISAFGEGWGLYSEWLGLEAGFYTDPYSDFGRLTYEMWRAARLVVDTGLHAKGWSREQAREFLASNTALSLHEIATETDRYISWPAQALSYKLGELEIKKLRRQAEEALGERFDVRKFHDAILANGSVPLPVLHTQIQSWIETQ